MLKLHYIHSLVLQGGQTSECTLVLVQMRHTMVGRMQQSAKTRWRVKNYRMPYMISKLLVAQLQTPIGKRKILL